MEQLLTLHYRTTVGKGYGLRREISLQPTACENKEQFPLSMVRDGIYYGIGLGLAGAIVAHLATPLWAAPLFVLALFCLHFFRDPQRTPPSGNVAVSPADGKVVAIVPEGPGQTRISIFLNVFDVHVNRSPIQGKVVGVRYHKGDFLVASLEEASVRNEQNTLTVEDAQGSQVVFKQIAGLIARRIVCWKHVGDTVGLGERVGLIKFGSRVDILLGPEWEVAVQTGQRVRAGASVIAQRRA